MTIGYDIFWHLHHGSPVWIATVPTHGKVEQMLHSLEWVMPGDYFTRDLATGEIVFGVESAPEDKAWEDGEIHRVQEAQRNEIARRAYELYLRRGCEHGRDVEDWMKAEKALADEAPVPPVRTSFPQSSASNAN